MLSTTCIAAIQKGQGLGSGYKWLAELVSRVCKAGLVFEQGLHRESKHFGVQISRDSTSHSGA